MHENYKKVNNEHINTQSSKYYRLLGLTIE